MPPFVAEKNNNHDYLDHRLPCSRSCVAMLPIRAGIRTTVERRLGGPMMLLFLLRAMDATEPTLEPAGAKYGMRSWSS